MMEMPQKKFNTAPSQENPLKKENIQFTNIEKKKFLKKEYLEDLSIEEYIALWRKLNPYFLTHVTGQGFRDHCSSPYHSDGMSELCDGFKGILFDNKLLRSTLNINLHRIDEPSVRTFLSILVLKAETEKEAWKRLDQELNYSIATAPKYPDQTSIHFANQLVADNFYGGEKNNEIFILYPSDVIASQYNFSFNGAEKDFTKAQTETMWNDFFVWPKSSMDGLPVDSGIVFLPENILVDPETGSKYYSEIRIIEGKKERILVEDEHLINAFVKWAENLNDESLIIQTYKEFKNHKNDPFNIKKAEIKCLEAFKIEIMKLGFLEDVAIDIVQNLFGSIDGIDQFQYTGKIGFGDSRKEVAINKLRSVGANWKRAENAISAKEYWENYFNKHPEQKPKHIVYYKGDPTSAVYEFQQKNGIGQADTSIKDGPLLGFDDMHVKDLLKDRRAWNDYDEIIEISKKIISEHYNPPQ